MKYLNEKERALLAAHMHDRPVDHIERVIFDKTLAAVLPGSVAGKYGDPADAIATALAAVAEFREWSVDGVMHERADFDGVPVPAPARSVDDEIPF